MKADEAKQGNVVRVGTIHGPRGILADPPHIAARRPSGSMGKIVGWTQPYSGDPDILVVWVEHKGGEAPYWNHELELVGVPCEDDGGDS